MWINRRQLAQRVEQETAHLQIPRDVSMQFCVRLVDVKPFSNFEAILRIWDANQDMYDMFQEGQVLQLFNIAPLDPDHQPGDFVQNALNLQTTHSTLVRTLTPSTKTRQRKSRWTARKVFSNFAALPDSVPSPVEFDMCGIVLLTESDREVFQDKSTSHRGVFLCDGISHTLVRLVWVDSPSLQLGWTFLKHLSVVAIQNVHVVSWDKVSHVCCIQAGPNTHMSLRPALHLREAHSTLCGLLRQGALERSLHGCWTIEEYASRAQRLSMGECLPECPSPQEEDVCCPDETDDSFFEQEATME